MYYCNARYYSPLWRRFISPDDTAYLDPESINGLNLYCYCGNDPVNYVDPSGHEWYNVLAWIGVALVAAALTVLTLGAFGVAVGGAGLLGAVIHGAAVGTLVGAGVGAALGAAGGMVYDAVQGNEFGTSIWAGIQAGFGIGAIAGAAIGGSVGYTSYIRSTVIVNGERVPVYRGGNDLTLKPKEYKILDNGSKRGLSVNANPNQVEQFGGAYRVKRIPRGLKIVQQGKNPCHFEIIPNDPLILDDFQSLIYKIALVLS